MFVDAAFFLASLGRVSFQEKSMNAPQSSPTPIAYSPKDACAALGIGLTSLYLEIARGRINVRLSRKSRKSRLWGRSLYKYVHSAYFFVTKGWEIPTIATVERCAMRHHPTA